MHGHFFLHFFAVSRKSSPLATLCHSAPFLCRNLPRRLQQIHYRLSLFSFRPANGWVSPGGLLLSWQQTHLAEISKELSFILVDPQVARSSGCRDTIAPGYSDMLRFTHAAEALHAKHSLGLALQEVHQGSIKFCDATPGTLSHTRLKQHRGVVDVACSSPRGAV